MKIIKRKQLPEFDENLHQELVNSGWITLREPGTLAAAIILSVPFMVANLFISVMSIGVFSTISLEEFGFTPDSFSITIDPGVIISLVFVIIFHELLHLMFIPNFMSSTKTYVGLALFGGFVYTEEEIEKSRFKLITVAPFLIVSIILPIILGLFGILTSPLKLLILLNATASSVDMLSLLFVIMQVPNKAMLKNNGPKTYWKPH
ncbi:DUF3267 domain-containing protein [Candidatus Contubernalis alkalaceticus]|nr:DUF3267 domain-containing protein [Candidatus Contubernalis alkalaceticus]